MLASFSWECTLKITKFKVELLTNVDMILHYENAIKGWITRAIYHYGEANKKYMHFYDETKEITCIQYLDFNYGWALPQPIFVVDLNMLKIFHCLNTKTMILDIH